MKKTSAPAAGNFLRLGSVVFGPVPENAKNVKVYSRLFKCHKEGFDFMGQVKIDLQFLKIDTEIFNAVYFDYFDVCKDEVAVGLEKKLLSKLSLDRSLPEGLKETVRVLIGRERVANNSKLKLKLKLNGKIDLKEMFDRLNADYFKNKIKASVEWGKKVNKKNLTSFRFGSYDPEKKIIRIHPRLQCDFVPQYVLELTMYHEMCHQWAPMKRKKGMWVAHHPQFKAKEMEYRFYEEARAWEKKNWKKLMRPISTKNEKNKFEVSNKTHKTLEITTLTG